MGPAHLPSLMGELPGFRAVVDRLAAGGGPVRLLSQDGARAFLAAALWATTGRPALLLAPAPSDADRLYQDLSAWLSPDDTPLPALIRLPESEAIPFQRLAEDAAVSHGRLAALASLLLTWPDAPAPAREARQHPPLVVASVSGLLQRTIPLQQLRRTTRTISVGQSVGMQPLLADLASMGYAMEPAVEAPGAMSRRGGIVDLFPPGSPHPVRVELAGNTVESLRWFDPDSQRSLGPVASVQVIPAREHHLWPPPDGGAESGPGPAARAVAEMLERASASEDPAGGMARLREEMEMLLSGQPLDDAAFYAGLLDSGSVLDYLPPESLVLLADPPGMEETAGTLEEQADALRAAREARGELPPGFPSPWWPWAGVATRLQGFGTRAHLEWAAAGDLVDLGITVAPAFWGRLDAFAREVGQRTRRGERVVVLSHHADRLAALLKERDVGASVSVALDGPPRPGAATLLPAGLEGGLVVPIPSGPLAVFTDAEVFGHARRQRAVRRQARRRELFMSELAPGSYVVHVDHGIGRFVGTRSTGAGNGEREYLVLEYAEGDRLYVPTDHLDRVSTYVAPGEAAPSLTRLGTQEWARAKERARASAQEMASELISLYAARQLLPGHAFSEDTPWQRELEEAFPYVETRDQAEAIQAVKDAMAQPHPMDHLVCGDVGYGKTEIALRAAFKAVQDGFQVALLCPTTVLAHQHHATFAQRLSPYPVRVEVLSRFRTPREQQEVAEGLRSGVVDIVIGTHRLLQKDVAFKRLGLVVVDDEQRFGVAHKERFKQLRREVDVLTLSATPIPRTLSMALSGIREMSTIHTPPEDRQPVRTYVAEYSDELVQEAVNRELDRGGQVFFVHNRVRDIYEWAQRLQALVPRARVAVGHGKMDEEELAAVMASFVAGGADILACTTIVESGLDLPNVNTLIVHRPELLGLTQMYQLRGRVGRSSRRAHAYFLLPPGRRVTEAAQQRLKAILSYQELGAGFRIAMKDLEIRGAGNLLGAEQSGHLHAIGFDLYTRMLEEAVAEIKAARDQAPPPPPPLPHVTVDLPLHALIPETYIANLPQRLGVYQRLAVAADTEEVTVLGQELRDRFGPPPQPVVDLLHAVRVRVLAAAAGVESVATEGRNVALRLREPVGGARPLLQRELGAVARVGDTLVHLPLQGRWMEVLAWTLERMATFRERVLGLAGG